MISHTPKVSVNLYDLYRAVSQARDYPPRCFLYVRNLTQIFSRKNNSVIHDAQRETKLINISQGEL
jgi:hypothetical protein